MKNRPLVNRTIRFSKKILEDAKELGIDISEFCRRQLESCVKNEKKKRNSNEK